MIVDRVQVLPVTLRVPDHDGSRLLGGIARHGSIGGAARANAISQQADSERLRAMEDGWSSSDNDSWAKATGPLR